MTRQHEGSWIPIFEFVQWLLSELESNKQHRDQRDHRDRLHYTACKTNHDPTTAILYTHNALHWVRREEKRNRYQVSWTLEVRIRFNSTASEPSAYKTCRETSCQNSEPLTLEVHSLGNLLGSQEKCNVLYNNSPHEDCVLLGTSLQQFNKHLLPVCNRTKTDHYPDLILHEGRNWRLSLHAVKDAVVLFFC